jgi:multidrug efflux pump subunit AcrA (membrane-fusion protein)
MIAGLIAALALTLAWIPAPLKITAEGELTPIERRDLFATAHGLVEQVFVKHADRLTIGQPLVQLRDPALEMEVTRVTGELATARARLEVIEAARIASTINAGETPARRQQLAGEAADLRQQCHALEAQQALLETEQKSWTLQSPIVGQVLTWDVESLLSGRPIERGQVLLTVGNTAGDWEITARIRERDLRHLLSRENEAVGRRVDFLSALDSGTLHTGRVTKVSRVIDLNERGESTVRVTIALDQPRLPELQTGTTVWPRIDCGHRSLGYVWFHDLIDAVRSGIWLRR